MIGFLQRPVPWLVQRAPTLARRVLGAAAPAAPTLLRRALPWAPRVLRAPLYAAALASVAARSVREAVALGEELLDEVDDARARLTLARLHHRAGAIRRPLRLIDAVPPARRPRALEAQLRTEARRLDEELPAWEPVSRAASDSRRILYHAAQSLPHHSSGYATRTHGLVTSLRTRGWDVEVHTRLGYPNDRADFLAVRTVDADATIDGVPYRFSPARPRALDPDALHEASVTTLIGRARAQQAVLIHSASNHVVGLAGVEAARRIGLPSIYEVRGLWHMTRAAADPDYMGSEHYQLIERLEARAAAAADHVFVITGAVGDILAARGVPRARMTILPNAVDTDRFRPQPRDAGLVARWGLEDRAVIGYLGTFKHYEGLDDLLVAAAQLRARRGDDFRILLVGDGEAMPDLIAQTRALRLEEVVVFTGRQPHDAILRYYSLADVIAFPRKPLPVCEVVSPLKPFEAMAMARPIVVSDVAALREIVEPERTGLVHRAGDAGDLADQLARCLDRPAWSRELGERGAAWVRAHRSWQGVTAQIDAVYRELIQWSKS